MKSFTEWLRQMNERVIVVDKGGYSHEKYRFIHKPTRNELIAMLQKPAGITRIIPIGSMRNVPSSGVGDVRGIIAPDESIYVWDAGQLYHPGAAQVLGLPYERWRCFMVKLGADGVPVATVYSSAAQAILQKQGFRVVKAEDPDDGGQME